MSHIFKQPINTYQYYKNTIIHNLLYVLITLICSSHQIQIKPIKRIIYKMEKLNKGITSQFEDIIAFSSYHSQAKNFVTL